MCCCFREWKRFVTSQRGMKCFVVEFAYHRQADEMIFCPYKRYVPTPRVCLFCARVWVSGGTESEGHLLVRFFLVTLLPLASSQTK